MEGLSSLVNLRILDVSSNKITCVDDIGNLTQYDSFLTINHDILSSNSNFAYLFFFFFFFLGRLEDLWLNDNQIESLEGISEAVAGSRDKLATIYLENNPCVWSLAT